MEPKKYDSFTPKRATNIDGFFAKPSQGSPRKPAFRGPTANTQPKPATLADMPKRPQPQPVLSSTTLPVHTSGITPRSLEGGEGRHRRRENVPIDAIPEHVKSKKPHAKKRLFKRIGLFSGMLIVLLGLFGAFWFYKNIAKFTGNNNPLALLSAFTPVELKNQDGRVNILVAANSADDAGHDGANLTDSIMVLSLDTNKNTALMLSVPRDLWVRIPGEGYAKINSAYTTGGMDSLQSVVQDSLGLDINYQVLVNYGAVKDLVNTLGGISITVASDDPRGIYDPSLDYTSRTCCALVKYPNGSVTLDGKQALNLARARGDAYGSYGYAQSDFTRTQYQREMLVAIKNKASQASVIANPFKVLGILDAVGSNIKTNLQPNEIQTLYTYMKKIDDSKIDSYNINTLMGENRTMLANYTSPSGQSALIPAAGLDDFSQIKLQLQKVFTADPLVKEGANVVILNGTDTLGLAGVQESKLKAKGMLTSVGDAAANQATTTIIDNSNGKKPNTLAYLKANYKATVVTDAALTKGYPSADFIVILGTTAVPKPTTTQ